MENGKKLEELYNAKEFIKEKMFSDVWVKAGIETKDDLASYWAKFVKEHSAKVLILLKKVV